jgi:hypothetical protein
MKFKIVENGYICGIGVGNIGIEITEAEYNEIVSAIQTKPEETATIGYRLKTDLTWESYEKEPQPDPEDEDVPDSEALKILLGGAV